MIAWRALAGLGSAAMLPSARVIADSIAGVGTPPHVEVIGTTSLPETGTPSSQVPVNVKVLRSDTRAARDALDLSDLLNRGVGSINDITGNLASARPQLPRLHCVTGSRNAARHLRLPYQRIVRRHCQLGPDPRIGDRRRDADSGFRPGPTVVTDSKGERRGVDWIFNAWGGLKGGLYYPWDRDEQLAPQVCTHHEFARYAAALVLEGGAIHTDGEGTLMVTEEVMLNPDRNPDLTKEQIGEFLRDYLHVDKIIWLPLGVFADETSGRIDNMCCFARPGEVILTWADDKKDPQYRRSLAALDVLKGETDARGRRLKVNKVNQPKPP